jgi:hypothetical protein
VSANIVTEEKKKKIEEYNTNNSTNETLSLKIPSNETNIGITGNKANDILAGIAFTKSDKEIFNHIEQKDNNITKPKKDDLETNHKSLFRKLSNIIVDTKNNANSTIANSQGGIKIRNMHNEIHSHSHITRMVKVIKMHTSIIIVFVVMLSIAGLLGMFYYQKGKHITLPIEEDEESIKIVYI